MGSTARAPGDQLEQASSAGGRGSAQRAQTTLPPSFPITPESLGAGAPFPPGLAQAFGAIAGVPVTREALTRLYAHALPGLRPVLTEVAQQAENVVGFRVAWLDGAGNVRAESSRQLARHEDGALELHVRGVWVDPELRGRGASVRLLEREVEMLRALSSHPQTRLTLRAGGSSDPKDRSTEQRVGSYFWAQLGFTFADAHGQRSQLIDYGPRAPGAEEDELEVTDLTLLRQRFYSWLMAQHASGALDCDAALLPELILAAEHWEAPWDIASFDVGPELRVPVELDGAPVPAGLGKAFLLDAQTPLWDGVLHVHASGASKDLLERAVGRSARTALLEATARHAALEGALRSPELERRLEAIEQVGLEGTSSLRPALEALRASDPAAGAAVETALLRLDGKGVYPGLIAIARAETETLDSRLGALLILAASGVPFEELRPILRGSPFPGLAEDLRAVAEATPLPTGMRVAAAHLLFDLEGEGDVRTFVGQALASGLPTEPQLSDSVELWLQYGPRSEVPA